MKNHSTFMEEAITLAAGNIQAGGGPFGAVVVKNGEIIGRGVNKVTAGCDPTAHAEVVAIRQACAHLGDFSLTGCVIYSSCEPCPMCLAAIYWARLDALYYAATREDAAAAGFDDSLIYDQVPLPPEKRTLPSRRLLAEKAREVFTAWLENPEKVPY